MLRRISLIVLFTLAFSAMLFCQTAPPAKLTVGTAPATPGSKSYGSINVPAGVDAGTDIPVVVIQGKNPGPVLALVAGAHGTEYTSIVALAELTRRLDTRDLSGTVIIVPLVNQASFDQKVPHVNPVDSKSMNRFYPGKPDGTQTERALYAMTKQVVEQSDYLIDLHGGDLDESLRPYSYWSKSGDEKMDAVTRGMVLAFGLDHIIVVTDRPRDPAASRYLESTATSRGKPAITAEAGYTGTVDPSDLKALEDGCMNVMRYLKMLPGTVTPVANPVWYGKVDTVTSDRGGIFHPSVQRGAHVEAGTTIGYVTDVFGHTIFEAKAPVAGDILYICGVPSMKKGDTVANIGEIVKTP